ncbi:MAG: M48 family metalloprotease [Theionarchaea archaeon]|nr:M48 family metalloprotease [Theionarchaea archaeon]
MIDLGFAERFLIGVIASMLGFLLVEFIVKVTRIQCSSQKSHLYMVALVSCFFSILYVPFLFNIQARENRIFLYVPNIVKEMEITLRMGFSHWIEEEVIFDFRFILTILLIASFFFFLVTVFLSRYYIKKQFHAEECKDIRLTAALETVCCTLNMKIPEVFLIEGVNAFVFGLPASLAVGKDLLKNTSERELRLILRHEMNHIKHHDNILKPLLVSMRIFLFMNPVVHILSRKIAREREYLADRVSDKKKEKITFLYALVRLGELHIQKKRSILSITSTPLVKSDFRARTDMLLSGSRKSNIWLYVVSFWAFALLLIAGAYAAGDLMHFGGIPKEDAAPNHLDGFTGPTFFTENIYLHDNSLPGHADAPGMKEVLPFPGPFFLDGPSRVLERMGVRFYDVGVEAVVVAVFAISLSGCAARYAKSALSRKG